MQNYDAGVINAVRILDVKEARVSVDTRTPSWPLANVFWP